MQQGHPMRTAEQEAVLRAVRKLVDFWQIEAHELDGIAAPRGRAFVRGDQATRPTYRHPISGVKPGKVRAASPSG